ncbi:MAG: hypothetical protein ACK56F_02345, partial [bacterium]
MRSRPRRRRGHERRGSAARYARQADPLADGRPAGARCPSRGQRDPARDRGYSAEAAGGDMREVHWLMLAMGALLIA